MRDDSLSAALPLMRRFLEAHHRRAEVTAEPDDPEHAIREGQYDAALVALRGYLVASGWTPPRGEGDLVALVSEYVAKTG